MKDEFFGRNIDSLVKQYEKAVGAYYFSGAIDLLTAFLSNNPKLPQDVQQIVSGYVTADANQLSQPKYMSRQLVQAFVKYEKAVLTAKLGANVPTVVWQDVLQQLMKTAASSTEQQIDKLYKIATCHCYLGQIDQALNVAKNIGKIEPRGLATDLQAIDPRVLMPAAVSGPTL